MNRITAPMGAAVLLLGGSVAFGTWVAAQRSDAVPLPPAKFASATYMPLGVGSEATATTAWFIDTTHNRVISCSTRGGCTAHAIPAP